MNKKRPNMNRGAAIFFVLFMLLFVVVCARFISIQLTGEASGKALAAYAENKYSRERPLEASRGSILDRHGEPLAIDTVAYRLIAIISPDATPKNADKPNHVVDPAKTASVLSQYIPMEENEIYNRLTLQGWQVEFGEAGRNLSHELKEEIEALELPGITFIRERKRSYPNGIFASHLLGFASFPTDDTQDPTKLYGQMGLEKTLERYLEEKDGKIEYKSDIWGYILHDRESAVTPPEDGANVYLTLDKTIQSFLEDAMSQVNEEYQPKNMMGVVADAKTGEILAMAQRPTFNPNTREGIEENWQNIVVETAIEPGSTMKIFTLASAVEEGVWNPNAWFESGSYSVKGGTIRDHNWSGWGSITYLEGFQRSSNVLMARLVEQMGPETFRNYLDKFKFGQPTDIGLENESSGIIQYKYPIDKVSTSFGQATAVTALQMIQAMTAITNDGKMMKPQIIDKIVDDNGELIEDFEPEVIGTPISSESAKIVREVLHSTVTSEHGTARRYNITGYDVGGKTGTAQIYEPGVGYLRGWDNYIFSFLGFAPVDDPEIIVYVVVQQPNLNEEEYESGSVPVSKIFNTVTKHSLQYLNIQPDDSVTKVQINSIPDLKGKTVDEAKNVVSELNLEPVIIGEGEKVKQTVPHQSEQLIPSEKVLIITDGKLTMPDVNNWSLRDVLKLVSATSIKFEYEGTGFVTEQNLEPGTVLSKESLLKVKLQTPMEVLENKENNDLVENEQETEKNQNEETTT